MNNLPTEVHPALALQLGWDQEAASNQDVVTLIRRKVVLEEVVISREKFDQINQAIENDEDEYWSDLDFQDAQWEDYTIENTLYTAWSGDVTSCSDDCVNFYDNEWSNSYEPIKLKNS